MAKVRVRVRHLVVEVQGCVFLCDYTEENLSKTRTGSCVFVGDRKVHFPSPYPNLILTIVKTQF